MKRVKLTIEGFVDDKVFETLLDREWIWARMPVTICGNMLSIAITGSEVVYQSSGDMPWIHDGMFTAQIVNLSQTKKIE